MDAKDETLVWLSARLVALLHGPATAAHGACDCLLLSCSSSLLRVRLRDRSADAGLVCLDWSCASESSSRHSKWIDDAATEPVQRVANANAVLGRGAHESPFEVESEGRLALYASPRLGRFVAATQSIPRGACALRATAFAVVVAERALTKTCHWCFSTLSRKAFRCGACEFALYCSRDCLQADAVLHDPVCGVLSHLKTLPSKASWIDKELLRLTLAVLSMEAFVQNPHALDKLTVSAIPRSTSLSPQDQALDAAAALLCSGLKKTGTPALRSLTRAHVRLTIQKLQSNAHPLYIDASSGVCGLGIFPEAAMTVNHSCSPNVVPTYDPKTRSLGFFAIQDINPMELIEYSYLSDLSVGRMRRQETLLDGFGFTCECIRCTNELAKASDTHAVDAEETELLKRLMEWSTQALDPLEVAGKLRELESRHAKLLQSRADLQFSLKMLELRSATQAQDLRRVVTVAETLLELWQAQGLPSFYPTVETLYLQVFQAASRLGDTLKASHAKIQADEIRRVCGGKN